MIMNIGEYIIRLISCIAILLLLFQPILGYAESNLNEREQAAAMEFGLFLGGAATQYDQCVDKGYIPSEPQKAEDKVISFIKRSEQAAPDEKTKQNYVYVQKGWDLAKQKIKEQTPKYWEDNCTRIIEQWNKYLKMLKQ
jgi:hypothetical protein